MTARHKRRHLDWRTLNIKVNRCIMLAAFVLGMLFSVAGLHNMDNGQNLRSINGYFTAYNISMKFSEYSSMGSEGMSAEQCYMKGFYQALIGGSILAAMSLSSLLSAFEYHAPP